MTELSGASLVHVDDHLLVADKPTGLLCVPGRGEAGRDCLSARVQQQYPDALIVHRLDMATSGLCVLARGPQVQRHLSMAFAAREVHKRYVAVVRGRLQGLPDGAWSVIDLPLSPDWPNRPLSKVDPKDGKPSLTRWRVLAHDDIAGTTRLELEPVTGRSHQLRLHLQAIGHPILGDALYAAPPVQAMAARLLLHATAITLPHPATGAPLSLQSPVPF
jgi:tRNA pseudouridine32 synthase/23S rRNA pseudouridine746 synthase